MRYIKTIKTYGTIENKNNAKKGDFIIKSFDYMEVSKPDEYKKDDNLYILLEDAHDDENGLISTYYIGSLNRMMMKVNLVFKRFSNDISKIYNYDYRVLTENEKKSLYKAIEISSNNKYGKEYYLDIINEEIGIELRDLEGYKNYLIQKNIKKYNL